MMHCDPLNAPAAVPTPLVRGACSDVSTTPGGTIQTPIDAPITAASAASTIAATAAAAAAAAAAARAPSATDDARREKSRSKWVRAVRKVCIVIRDPTSDDSACIVRVAMTARYAIGWRHRYMSSLTGVSDTVCCYFAMRSHNKKTMNVWRRIVTRATVYDVEAIGDDTMTAMCKRYGRPLAPCPAAPRSWYDKEEFRFGRESHPGTNSGLMEIKARIRDGASLDECIARGIGGDAVLKFACAIRTFEIRVKRERENAGGAAGGTDALPIILWPSPLRPAESPAPATN